MRGVGEVMAVLNEKTADEMAIMPKHSFYSSERATEKDRETFRFILNQRGTFCLLDEKAQSDVLHGRCILKEYQGVPILDYQ